MDRRQKKELGVRKALGASNKEIILLIILQYEFYTIISSIIALILHLIIKNKLEAIFQRSFEISLTSIITVIVVAMLIGLISALFPIKKSLKMQPDEIMRGR